MLWLCMHFPQLPVELRQPADPGPIAIIERRGGRRCVLAVNARAGAAGIHPGMDAVLALGREPALQLIGRSAAQERGALRALAAWAHQWSGDICVDAGRALVALEAGASRRLFGSLAALREQLLTGAAALGYTVQVGMAPTWEAAALLACSDEPACVQTLEAARTEIARRPLAELAVPDTIREPLRAAGLADIGAVLRIPTAALARRFGPGFTAYLRRLLGECPDPRRRFRMADRYRRTLTCAYPVDNAQALLFPLRRMLQELQGWLRGRDVAVESLTVTLRHREAPDTTLGLRLSAPQREAAALIPLLRAHLERAVLPAPATRIILEAKRLVAPAITQGDLFGEHAHDARWPQLLDRLRARLGDAAIRELHLADDHRPERAWCTAAPRCPADPRHPLPQRPVWILAPRSLRAPPKLVGIPERIEAGWWEGTDTRRDYYVAETPGGALWWVYRDLDSDRWFLHGMWA